ncbi:MAG: hypothetical protein Q7T33_01270, partial [Dehalococcoidia bacterium]|nr:hypothetical protein [Dehalococcoidia bacterium]
MGYPFRHSVQGSADWRLAAAVAVVVVQVSHLLWTLLSPMQGAALHWVANLFIDASVAIAFALVLTVAMRYRGSRLGVAWALLAAGLLFNLFAEVSWSVQELAFQEDVPFPSVSDIGYVGAYAPTLVGLLLMPQAPFRALSRVKLGLDALIVTSALAILSWFLIVQSILNSTGISPQAKALSVFYPFADLAMVFAAFVLVARVGRTRFALAFGLLAAGYFATAFSDSVYAYLTEAGYATGSYIDIGWAAGYSLMSLAALVALHPMAAFEPRTRQAEPTPAFWPSVAPYAAVLPLALLLLDKTRGGGADTALTVGFLAVLALIVLRQVLA